MKSEELALRELWDEVAEYPVAQSDQALEFLLRALCERVQAWNAGWIAAIRMPQHGPDDPVSGWRPREAGYLSLTPEIESARIAQYRRLEAGEVDPNIAANLAGAGRWRASRLVDLVGQEWFESEYYQRFYLDTDRADAIWVGCPVNHDLEIYVAFYRRAAQPRFSEADRDDCLQALSGLKWFFRQHLFSHGLLIAEAPLTPTEREILQALLAGDSKNVIAERSGRSPHTVHHHCKSIYQKFGVNNRAALMALWLNWPTARPSEQSPPAAR